MTHLPLGAHVLPLRNDPLACALQGIAQAGAAAGADLRGGATNAGA
jgi:hypothetical protein